MRTAMRSFPPRGSRAGERNSGPVALLVALGSSPTTPAQWHLPSPTWPTLPPKTEEGTLTRSYRAKISLYLSDSELHDGYSLGK